MATHIDKRDSLIRDALIDGIRNGCIEVTFRTYGDYRSAINSIKCIGYKPSVLAAFSWFGLSMMKELEAKRAASFIIDAIKRDTAIFDIISSHIVVMLFGPEHLWRYSASGNEVDSKQDYESRIVFTPELEKERYFQVFLGTRQIPIIPPSWLQQRFDPDDDNLSDALNAFRFDMSDGDELWHYCKPPSKGARTTFDIGFALVRNGVPIKYVSRVSGIRGS